MLLVRLNRLVGPCCSTAPPLLGTLRQPHQPQHRSISQAPPFIAPLFEYAADCNVTQGIQWSMEAIHSTGVPWVGSFVLSAVALRLLTAPFHVYAEKLFAKRLHAQRFFTEAIVKKVSDHYKISVDPVNKHVLNTLNKEAVEHAQRLVKENVPAYLVEHKLQASRIQNLKMCSIPVWILSSFALRNIIAGDFSPAVPGGLWTPDMLVPDPYFVIPAAVGALGFLNLWSQRKIYPALGAGKARIYVYDTALAFMTTAAVFIMAQLPAVIPMYWLVVSATGFAQAQLLRHPRIKSVFGIMPLPTDSRTPLRDIFLTRKAAL